MAKDYVIAYDRGTSGVKAALVDLDGNFMAARVESYPLYTERPGWAEQEPSDYWEGVLKATRRVVLESGIGPEGAKGIVFGSQWKGIIPVDGEGKALRRSMIWLDRRAEEEAERLNAHFGKRLFYASDYWPKLLWFREHCPELYGRTKMILEVNSFLKWKATGRAAMDVTNHFVKSFDGELQAFYDRFLEEAGISADKFPPMVKPEEKVGVLTDVAAKELGLVAGIPVFGGCGDIPAIAIGSGCMAQGEVHAYFGSSGWLGLVRAHSPKDLYVSPFDGERDIFLYPIQAIGLALNWTIRQFYRREAKELGEGIYDLINEDLADVPPGSGGVLAAPWMFGERPPLFSEAARGTFLNLNSCHDRRHMVKAVMEGVCYTLKMNVENDWERGGMRPTRICAVGGGAGSGVWMQALADILEVPVQVPANPRHAGAIGTACCARIGLGLCESFEEAAGQIKPWRSFRPRPEAVAIYRKGYETFRGLYRLLEPVFVAAGDGGDRQ